MKSRLITNHYVLAKSVELPWALMIVPIGTVVECNKLQSQKGRLAGCIATPVNHAPLNGHPLYFDAADLNVEVVPCR